METIFGLTLRLLFCISAFMIFWAMIGYPFSLVIIGKLHKSRQLKKDYSHQPTVTVMIVTHNEDKTIAEKLNNIFEIDYPQDKIEILIASDHNTDRTNEVVREYIGTYPERKIRLYETKERKGKTNAQNEAQKTVKTEYMVMTDANSMLDKYSVKELMAAFTSKDIVYVCGKMVIVNQDVSVVSNLEARYWDRDLAARELEGRVQTITAGNGALYSCRTSDYYDFNPIQCHDSSMPIYYALQGKRAICNHAAIAYEKAGEKIEDEFGRKIRMNRSILNNILPEIKILNVLKYRWFSYFYFGHRTCRYLLWIMHLMAFVTNALLISHSWFFAVVFTCQVLFFLAAILRMMTKANHKPLNMIFYYCVTVCAQWVGVFNIVTGKARPFWEKAESTR